MRIICRHLKLRIKKLIKLKQKRKKNTNMLKIVPKTTKIQKSKICRHMLNITQDFRIKKMFLLMIVIKVKVIANINKNQINNVTKKADFLDLSQNTKVFLTS